MFPARLQIEMIIRTDKDGYIPISQIERIGNRGVWAHGGVFYPCDHAIEGIYNAVVQIMPSPPGMLAVFTIEDGADIAEPVVALALTAGGMVKAMIADDCGISEADDCSNYAGLKCNRGSSSDSSTDQAPPSCVGNCEAP